MGHVRILEVDGAILKRIWLSLQQLGGTLHPGAEWETEEESKGKGKWFPF